VTAALITLASLAAVPAACFAEAWMLRRLFLRHGWPTGTRVLAALGVYAMPFAVHAAVVAMVSLAVADTSWTWMGETMTVSPRQDAANNAFLLAMMTWPFVVLYGLAGGVVLAVEARRVVRAGTGRSAG
jgi:hypothetical protein